MAPEARERRETEKGSFKQSSNNLEASSVASVSGGETTSHPASGTRHVSAGLKIVRLDSKLFPVHALEAELYQLYGLDPVEVDANTPEQVLAACGDADVLINVSTRLSRETLGGLKCCRHISHTGVGTDKTDVDAATDYRIVVSNDPGFCSEDAADHAMAMLLSLSRKLPQMSELMRLGRFGKARSSSNNCRRLSARVLGLVGFGSIGSIVAQRANAFGMRVLATCRDMGDAKQQVARDLGVELVDLDLLLSNSDYVSLHLPLTSETYHLIDDIALRKMKPTAFLINTARGALVDEAALVRALREGRLAGAGIDTFERLDVNQEIDPSPRSPFLELDNVILSPHVAGLSVESRETWARIAVENLVSVVNHHWPLPDNVVNKTVLPKYPLAEYDETIFKHSPVGPA